MTTFASFAPFFPQAIQATITPTLWAPIVRRFDATSSTRSSWVEAACVVLDNCFVHEVVGVFCCDFLELCASMSHCHGLLNRCASLHADRGEIEMQIDNEENLQTHRHKSMANNTKNETDDQRCQPHIKDTTT